MKVRADGLVNEAIGLTLAKAGFSNLEVERDIKQGKILSSVMSI